MKYGSPRMRRQSPAWTPAEWTRICTSFGRGAGTGFCLLRERTALGGPKREATKARMRVGVDVEDMGGLEGETMVELRAGVRLVLCTAVYRCWGDVHVFGRKSVGDG